MTSKSKIVFWIIAIIIVIGLIWWYAQWKASSPTMPEQSPYSQNPTGTSSSALPQGNSNTALDQSLQAIDNQLSGLSSDSASVNQGLSDQPISQGQ